MVTHHITCHMILAQGGSCFEINSINLLSQSIRIIQNYMIIYGMMDDGKIRKNRKYSNEKIGNPSYLSVACRLPVVAFLDRRQYLCLFLFSLVLL